MTDIPAHLSAALEGGYRIERELGRGGMARVFVARELALERDVVIKVVRSELLEGVSVSRFAREVRLAARLQQANIVPVLAAGDADGTPYYTMPYVRGESLARRLEDGPPMPLREAVGVLRDVARALAYAHGEGIVHRDIKPANVLLSGGAAMVTDFGIAKAIDASRTLAPGGALTAVGASLGTPAYIAPEQAAGDPATDHRADLYAWGIMAWELLAGRHPFSDRSTPHQLLAAHMSEPVPALETVRPDIPPALSDLVARCVEKDPADRPENARAVLSALDTVILGPAGDGADMAANRGTGPGDGTAKGDRATGSLSGVARSALAVFAVIAVATLGWWAAVDRRDDGAPAGSATTSIAVLPFTDLSPDRSNTYLGDGVAETLIHALSTVPGLTVSGRASTFSLRDSEDDLQAIGRELGVSSVLLGSVQQAGGELRVSARVVRVADDSILWSGRFDRPAEDIFVVQDEVARAVTEALRPSPAGVDGEPADLVGGTADPAAYDAYLLGRYHWNLRTTDGMIRAREAFERAIAIDSTYAQAWSGLADALVLSVPGEYNVPGVTADSVLPLAEAAARRAIRLAPEMGEGHASLGQVLSKDQRPEEALAAYERGIELSPSYPTGHQWYSYSLLRAGRWEDGTREMEIAHRLDPLAHVITLSLAIAYDGSDRFDEAAPLYRRGLEQSPQAWYGWRFLTAHELARGRLDQAGVAMRRALNDVDHPSHDAWLRLSELVDDPERLADAALDLTGTWEWDLGIPLVRWLHGEEAVAGYLARVREAGTGIPSNLGWGLGALLGPRLRDDPAVQEELRALYLDGRRVDDFR